MATTVKQRQVETYRVLRDGMQVGNSVRHPGDLIPEAAEWANVDVYLRNDYVERVYVSPEELAEFKKKIQAKNRVTKKVVKKTAAKKRVLVKKTENKEKSNGRLAEAEV